MNASELWMLAFSPALPIALSTGAISPWIILPFALLLLLIATMPLTPPLVKHAWEKYYPLVACTLAAIVAAYYIFVIPNAAHTLLQTAHEYVSFIALIGSLFVVAGGIHIKVKGGATPIGNVLFLLLGAVLANVVGTTGASMVLIRPFIRMNKVRISAYHIVFFIFITSNVGGSLTPIGDPPLFLGYLQGVPFFWLIEHVIGAWFFAIGALLGAFYLFDRWSFKRAPSSIQHALEAPDTFRIDGGINILLLFVIIAAVFLPDRFFARELVMLSAAAASMILTNKTVHQENHFSFGPIKEVAFLFVGIFITMMPALGYLEQHGPEIGLTRPAQYYYATGALSSVLDNAPTYLNFLKLAEVSSSAQFPDAFSAAGGDEKASIQILLRQAPQLVVAVSLGAVFFGAMTYIGNGPNFMVKSIAESAGVKVPSFFGYIIRFSLPILLPILIAASIFF